MIGNILYWRRVFAETFAAEVHALRDAVTTRLVPSFGDLETEADAVAAREYGRLGSVSDGEGGGWDMADAAEWAQDQALTFYARMTGVRQGLINLSAAGAYHLYEQQASHFLRRELIRPWEEHDPTVVAKLLKQGGGAAETMRDRLADAGIDLRALPSYATLDELRLVANVVKHGQGKSAQDLYARRPALFTHPDIRALPEGRMVGDARARRLRVERPVMGEDLYVTVAEFEAYTAAVVAFWAELGAALPDRHG